MIFKKIINVFIDLFTLLVLSNLLMLIKFISLIKKVDY